VSVVKSSLYNALGLGLPLVVAVFSIPILISELGDAQFGLLTLVWAVVGYFGLFDLGLGRALTQQLSVAIARGNEEKIPPLVMTAILLMVCLGLLSALLMAFLAPLYVGSIDSVPDKENLSNAIICMAASIPAIVLTSGFRGVLEARGKFGIINLIRLPMGLFTFLGPVFVVSYFGPSMFFITCVLAVGRVLACVVHAFFALNDLNLKGEWCFRKELAKSLCVSGGWLTLSNLISPLMSFVDRLFVGWQVSSSAVAYYSTPQEIVTKLAIIPSALTSVLFPRFSARFSSAGNEIKGIYYSSVIGISLIILIPSAVLSVWSHEIMSMWISTEFAHASSSLLAVFSWGMFIACIATIPFTLIQSAGGAKLTAMFHFVEFPIFIGLLYFLLNSYGAIGAAYAWFLRNLMDAIILFVAANFYLNGNKYFSDKEL